MYSNMLLDIKSAFCIMQSSGHISTARKYALCASPQSTVVDHTPMWYLMASISSIVSFRPSSWRMMTDF